MSIHYPSVEKENTPRGDVYCMRKNSTELTFEK